MTESNDRYKDETLYKKAKPHFLGHIDALTDGLLTALLELWDDSKGAKWWNRVIAVLIVSCPLVLLFALAVWAGLQ